MNEGDRERLERLYSEWCEFPSTVSGIGHDRQFLEWLVRHSGWTVLPPDQVRTVDALELQKMLRPGSTLRVDGGVGPGPDDQSFTGTCPTCGQRNHSKDKGWRRDEFAGQALVGLLANSESGPMQAEDLADWAVEQADALIAELDKETK